MVRPSVALPSRRSNKMLSTLENYVRRNFRHLAHRLGYQLTIIALRVHSRHVNCATLQSISIASRLLSYFIYTSLRDCAFRPFVKHTRWTFDRLATFQRAAFSPVHAPRAYRAYQRPSSSVCAPTSIGLFASLGATTRESEQGIIYVLDFARGHDISRVT